ncbi:MAG: UDP-N-acetylmuramate dehydrogenase [Spirochaetaceae bacterium]
MNRILEILNKINIEGTITQQVDMSKYTTFKCGGLAQFFIEPALVDDVIKIKKAALENDFPLFILGGGANLLVSDNGIDGVTLSLNTLKKIDLVDNIIIAEAGVSVNKLSEYAEKHSLSGLEFIYGMPGSLGGATWMNARCYGDEISNIFLWAEYLDQNGKLIRQEKDSSQWEYKISPFQKPGITIIRVALKLKHQERALIKPIMLKNSEDRRKKGHFKYPCAGSVFKNNRDFGAPSGKIIEDCGLKGCVKGNAAISDFHANIIVNLGGASSNDINFLIEKIIKTVKEKKGFILEPEVLKVGNWEN